MVAPAAGCDAPEGGIEPIDFGPDFLGAANELVGSQKEAPRRCGLPVTTVIFFGAEAAATGKTPAAATAAAV